MNEKKVKLGRKMKTEWKNKIKILKLKSKIFEMKISLKSL